MAARPGVPVAEDAGQRRAGTLEDLARANGVAPPYVSRSSGCRCSRRRSWQNANGPVIEIVKRPDGVTSGRAG